MRNEHRLLPPIAVWIIAATLALASCGGGEVPAQTPSAPPSQSPPPPAAPDTIAPSAPANVSATATSAVSVRLTWSAATDNVGVSGYRIFRDGNRIGTSTGTTYDDSGLAPSTTYRYEVAAFDAAGNVSARSTPAAAATPAASGRIISATPADYLAKLRTLQPGDTLVLAPGTYDNPNDVPGLPLFDLNGTPSQPITITGPDNGPRPVLLGRSTHVTGNYAALLTGVARLSIGERIGFAA